MLTCDAEVCVHGLRLNGHLAPTVPRPIQPALQASRTDFQSPPFVYRPYHLCRSPVKGIPKLLRLTCSRIIPLRQLSDAALDNCLLPHHPLPLQFRLPEAPSEVGGPPLGISKRPVSLEQPVLLRQSGCHRGALKQRNVAQRAECAGAPQEDACMANRRKCMQAAGSRFGVPAFVGSDALPGALDRRPFECVCVKRIAVC